MIPPFRKLWIQRANAKPPQAPMPYLAPFQKNIAMAPPAIPATTDERTNMPRTALLGGCIAGMTPNLKISTMQTRESVKNPIRKKDVLQYSGIR